VATKTFRTIYISKNLDELLIELAKREQSSASRIIRIALEKYLKSVKTPSCKEKSK